MIELGDLLDTTRKERSVCNTHNTFSPLLSAFFEVQTESRRYPSPLSLFHTSVLAFYVPHLFVSKEYYLHLYYLQMFGLLPLCIIIFGNLRPSPPPPFLPHFRFMGWYHSHPFDVESYRYDLFALVLPKRQCPT
jgi:hypothetical protein